MIYVGKLYFFRIIISQVGFLSILKSSIKDDGQAYKGNIAFA